MFDTCHIDGPGVELTSSRQITTKYVGKHSAAGFGAVIIRIGDAAAGPGQLCHHAAFTTGGTGDDYCPSSFAGLRRSVVQFASLIERGPDVHLTRLSSVAPYLCSKTRLLAVHTHQLIAAPRTGAMAHGQRIIWCLRQFGAAAGLRLHAVTSHYDRQRCLQPSRTCRGRVSGKSNARVSCLRRRYVP